MIGYYKGLTFADVTQQQCCDGHVEKAHANVCSRHSQIEGVTGVVQLDINSSEACSVEGCTHDQRHTIYVPINSLEVD